MTVITIPKILREKLSDEGAEALVELLDKTGTRSEESMLDRAEDKFENRVAQLEVKLEKRFAELETKFEKRFAQLEVKIAESRADIIRWMFIFWIGQFASIVGVLTAILFAFFRK